MSEEDTRGTWAKIEPGLEGLPTSVDAIFGRHNVHDLTAAAAALRRPRPRAARGVQAAGTRSGPARPDAALAAQSRHTGTGWYEDWLDGLRRDGTLTRIVRSGLSFVDVVRVLDALPATDELMPVFADRVLHDAKALTEGPVRGLVLRALAGWQEVPALADTEQERLLWESVGVVPDDLASQVLVLNVPAGGGLVGSWLTQARQAGVPMRLTLYQLRLASLVLGCDEIFVCENPAVLRAAAAVLGPAARALVCTEGVPSAAWRVGAAGRTDRAVRRVDCARSSLGRCRSAMMPCGRVLSRRCRRHHWTGTLQRPEAEATGR
jgi:uncharacterized protein (TIGR02679 family)